MSPLSKCIELKFTKTWLLYLHTYIAIGVVL